MKNVKRIFSMLLCAALLLGLLPGLPVRASAEDCFGVCGPKLIWSFDAGTGVLTIAGEGEMGDYVVWSCGENGAEACLDSNKVESLVIGEGVTSIGKSAFNGFVALKHVSIPASVERIDESAFFCCAALSELLLPEGVGQIGDYAFGECFALTSVQLPASLTELSPTAFRDCDALTEILAAPENPRYCSVDGVLFSKDLKELCIYPEQHGAAYSIPNGVERIGAGAFGNTPVSEVTIPDSVTCIGDSAFGNCYLLTELQLPAGLTSIGSRAFAMCAGLTELTIPDSVTDIGENAFYSCSALKRVVLPAGITAIEDWSFADCGSLRSVSIPDSVTRIGREAFWNCVSLRELELSAGLTEIGEMAFRGCRALSGVTLPESVKTVSARAFYDCPSLLRVVIPGAVQSLEEESFGYVYDGQKTVQTEGFAVWGCPDTEAQSYAARNGFRFVDLTENPTQSCAHQFKNGVCTLCGYAATAASEIFSDVSAGAYYEAPVLWAVQNGVTAGTGNGSFSPKQSCKREQAVTFLYSLLGNRGSGTANNPFADVREDKYYFNAVMWAVANGTTAGVRINCFGVGENCTREQAVTFIWKAHGAPEPESEACPFTDVQPGKYYEKAIRWALEKGITSGVGSSCFGVGKTCTRAQFVTFLYRLFQLG